MGISNLDRFPLRGYLPQPTQRRSLEEIGCTSTHGNLEDLNGCDIGPWCGYPRGPNTGEYCEGGCIASCDGKGCLSAWRLGDDTLDDSIDSRSTDFQDVE